MTDLDIYVNEILDNELNKNTSNKLISHIDDDVNFKYKF